MQLTSSDGASVGSPRWSPDSRWIAFDRGKESKEHIFVISAGGGAVHQPTSGTSYDVRPSWSRDGRWIYFGSNRSGAWQIWKTPAHGGAAVQPDGQWILYTQLDQTGSDLMLMENYR